MIRMQKRAVLSVALLLLAGQALADIVIGQVAPFSGPLAPTGNHLRAGAQLYIDSVNASGGVNGQRIRLVSKDDGYKVSETVRLAKELINEAQPVALFGFVGTGNVEELVKEKVLADAGIPLVTVRSGASSLAKSANPWLFFTRASYEAEINKIIELYAPIGYKKLAVFYQNDPFGLDGLASAEALAKKYDCKIVAKGSYEKNTTDVAAAVKAIAAGEPNAVIMVSNTAASAEFVKKSREAGNMAQLVALSVNDAPQIVERIGKQTASGLAITQVVPSPENRSIPIVREVMDSYARAKPADVAVNHALLEGYLGAKVLVEGLRRAGPSPTRRKLRDTLEQIKDYDAGELFVTYSATSHVGMNFVDINIINREGRLLK